MTREQWGQEIGGLSLGNVAHHQGIFIELAVRTKDTPCLGQTFCFKLVKVVGVHFRLSFCLRIVCNCTFMLRGLGLVFAAKQKLQYLSS